MNENQFEKISKKHNINNYVDLDIILSKYKKQNKNIIKISENVNELLNQNYEVDKLYQEYYDDFGDAE